MILWTYPQLLDFNLLRSFSIVLFAWLPEMFDKLLKVDLNKSESFVSFIDLLEIFVYGIIL